MTDPAFFRDACAWFFFDNVVVVVIYRAILWHYYYYAHQWRRACSDISLANASKFLSFVRSNTILWEYSQEVFLSSDCNSE